MIMQLNLMAQIFQRERSKCTKYSRKIKCARFVKVSYHSHLNPKKAIQIRHSFISFILLEVDNGLFMVFWEKRHSSFKSLVTCFYKN